MEIEVYRKSFFHFHSSFSSILGGREKKKQHKKQIALIVIIKAEAPEIISRVFLFMHLASMSKARGAEIQLPNQHRIFQMLSRKRIIIDSNVKKIKQGCQTPSSRVLIFLETKLPTNYIYYRLTLTLHSPTNFI